MSYRTIKCLLLRDLNMLTIKIPDIQSWNASIMAQSSVSLISQGLAINNPFFNIGEEGFAHRVVASCWLA
jgi:hypothetical protein